MIVVFVDVKRMRCAPMESQDEHSKSASWDALSVLNDAPT